MTDNLKSQIDTLTNAFKTTTEASQKEFGLLKKSLDNFDGSGSNVVTSPGLGNRMPLFSGDENENPILFMEEFTLYSQLLNRSDDQCLLTFPLSLKGQARLWFSTLPADSYNTIEELTELFRDRFVSPSLK